MTGLNEVEKRLNVCIFLISGKTFTFRDVKIISDNEMYLTFEYSAMSDGRLKRAQVMRDKVAIVSQWQD